MIYEREFLRKSVMREFIRWAVKYFPKRVVYFCAMRVIAHATTGKYFNQIVPDLTAIDAVERWAMDNVI